MQLGKLIKDLYPHSIEENFQDIDIQSISVDSRNIEKNSLFIALKGFQADGINFIHDAIGKGACGVVYGSQNRFEIDNPGVCFLSVEEPDKFLREVTRRFYGNPSAKVKTIGVTGTNGKTTLTYLTESILHCAEYSCGTIGTINYRIGSKILPSKNTTPGIVENQRLLAELAAQDVDYCIMEVSSHALDQGRVDLIDFRTAVFTNLTSDHLDYHKTRENYFAAKSKLFTMLSPQAVSIINADDTYGRKLFSKTQSKIITYAIEKNADVMAKDIEINLAGTQFKLVTPQGEIIIRSKLVGLYNVYNMLAAAAVGLGEEINLERIKKGIESVILIPGRLEKMDCGQEFNIFIDYAHTQDALANVLQVIRQTTDAKIILVFGCGGDRDKTKRPEMGRVASHLADFTIITTDNPRSEDPETIIKEIVQGFEGDNYTTIVERDKAIAHALKMAQKGDVVLIAGKGHENYQIFKDKTIPFDEQQVIRQALLC